MTDDEARKLAQRMVDTWPAGPKAYIWRDALIDLDPHYAAAAYRRISTEQDRPTVARYVAEYRAMLPHDEGARRGADPNAISLGEYLERVQLRAVNGSHEAQAEMDRWTKHLAGTTRSTPPTPADAERRILAEQKGNR